MPGPDGRHEPENLDHTGLQMHQIGAGIGALADDLARVADDEITATRRW
jgi:hypothetical protein